MKTGGAMFGFGLGLPYGKTLANAPIIPYKLDFVALNGSLVTFSDVTIVGDLYFEFTCPTFLSNFYVIGRSDNSNSRVKLRATTIYLNWSITEYTIVLSQSMIGQRIRVERVGITANIYLADTMTLIGTGATDATDFVPNALGTRAGGFLVDGQISQVDLNGQWIGDFTAGNGPLPDTVAGNDGILTNVTWVAL